MTGLSRRAARDDTGSTLPLILAYAVLAMLLITTVLAATALYLERKRLFTLADGAALAAAESFDLDAVTVIDGEVVARLDDALVAEHAADFVAIAPAASLDEVELVAATSPDGRSAAVTLRSAWRPPIVSLVLPEGVAVEVTARARTALQ